MNNEKIGKLIKNARLSKGYTQKEIANKLGVTDKAVSKWECGKSFPDITMIESISRELGISVNQLVGVADNSKEEAVMLEKNEKKIKIRIMISIIIFSVIAIKAITRLLCSFSTYWYISTIFENIVYFIFILIGVTSLISSIILIHKTRKMYEKNEVDD